MGIPVVLVDSGGLPVTEALNGFGSPITVADNGFGLAITIVASGGQPVVGLAVGFADGIAAPSGYHWDFVRDDADNSIVTDDVTLEPVVDLVAD